LPFINIPAKAPIGANENARSQTRYFRLQMKCSGSVFPGRKCLFLGIPVKDYWKKVIHKGALHRLWRFSALGKVSD